MRFSIAADLRGAVRGLLRNRSVSLLAAGCLALGLGTCAAMLGLLDVLVFRPPAHVREADSLRRVYLSDTLAGLGEYTTSVFSYPAFEDLQGCPSFQAAGAFFATTVSIGRGATADPANAVLATPGFFRMLGVRPARGRLFDAAEGQAGSPDFVALVSADLAVRGLGGLDSAVGSRLAVGRDLYTVVGVLPPRFTGIDLGAVDLWLPMNAAGRLANPKWATNRGSKFLEIVVRLRPQVEDAPATAAATTSYQSGAAAAGRPRPRSRVSLGALQAARGPEPPASVRVATWLAGLSWIVLLVSCANAAGLLFARTLERRAELALRLALGGGRRRLIALAFGEGAVVAALGALGAILLAPLLGTLVRRTVLPEAETVLVGPNLRTFALLAGLALGAALLASLVPALWLSRRRRLDSLLSGVRGGEPGASRVQAGLAAAQLALTFVLLVAAGSFGWSLYRVLHLRLGLEADRVLVANADLEAAGFEPAQVEEIWRRAAERLRPFSGVVRVARAATIPFATSVAYGVAGPGLAEVPELPTGGPYLNAVTEDFFAVTGTPVVRGRPFHRQDTASSAPVAIVNATMQRLLFPGRTALGACLRIREIEGAPCSTIVGVVADARRSELREEPTMQWYVPLDQAPGELTSRALFLRVQGDPTVVGRAARREIQALSPEMPFVSVRTLAELLEPQRRSWRTGAVMLALLALLALLLAVAGLYGVVAASMARRRFEMGVRSALGAERLHLFGEALRYGLGVAGWGAALGLVLALTAAARLEPLLFDASASNPSLLLGAALVILTTALVASYGPARGIWRGDLVRVLRQG